MRYAIFLKEINLSIFSFFSYLRNLNNDFNHENVFSYFDRGGPVGHGGLHAQGTGAGRIDSHPYGHCFSRRRGKPIRRCEERRELGCFRFASMGFETGRYPVREFGL